ncbi:MAG TPA: hypothetical protein VFJ82_14950 [Longimicrobium sp.]|nr:hypothetical protein [Longimicrobium sp.]
MIINELVLPGDEENFDPPDPSGPTDPTRPGRPGGSGGPDGPWGRRKAKSLRAIVRLYDELPELRNEQLRVPGCSGNTYGSVIRPLYWNARELLVDRRVYYGSLLFGAGVVEQSAGYKVTFVQGALKDRTQKFRLLVCTTGWAKTDVAAVRNALQVAIELTKDAYERERSGVSPVRKPWIFFLGEPVKGDPLLFKVDHPRALCSFEDPRFGVNTNPARPHPR